MILIEEALGEQAIDLFAYAPVLTINEVVEGDVAREYYLHQVAEYVVIKGGDCAVLLFGVQFAMGGVGVGGAVVVQ